MKEPRRRPQLQAWAAFIRFSAPFDGETPVLPTFLTTFATISCRDYEGYPSYFVAKSPGVDVDMHCQSVGQPTSSLS